MISVALEACGLPPEPRTGDAPSNAEARYAVGGSGQGHVAGTRAENSATSWPTVPGETFGGTIAERRAEGAQSRARDAPADGTRDNAEARQAERLYKEAIIIAESNHGRNHVSVIDARMALANLYVSQNRLTESEEMYRHVLDIIKTLYGDDHPHYATVLNNLAVSLYRQGRHHDAEATYNRALHIFRSKLGPNHPYVGQTLANLGKLHRARFSHEAPRDPAGPEGRGNAGAPGTQGAGEFGLMSGAPNRSPDRSAPNAAEAPAATEDGKVAKPHGAGPPKKQVLLVDEGSWKNISVRGKDAGTADVNKLTYSWDLDGDGKFETVGSTIRFDASQIDGPQTREIRVRADDGDGGSIVETIIAKIANVSPTADAGGPYQVEEGASIELTATGNDAAPADREDLAYFWDLDGDGLFETSGRIVTFSAAKIDGPKPVTVRLRVSDDDGGASEATTTVVVTNAPPKIGPLGPYVVEEGSAITLQASAIDPSPEDSKALSFAWDFDGDGIFETKGRTARFDASAIDGPATVTVRVRVTDDDGAAAVSSVDISVTNVAPTLSVGGPFRVAEGGTATLSVDGDDAAKSDRDRLSYHWDLDGNGTFETSGRTVEFDASRFDGPVSHIVRVRIADDDGAERTADVRIEVYNVPPTLHSTGTFAVDEGGTVELNVLATDASFEDAANLSYAWDLDGDGSFETRGRTVMFDATDIDGPSTRRVKVRVTDDDGGVIEDEVVVQIRNVAPNAVIIQIGD